jgi:hypothetical protein
VVGTDVAPQMTTANPIFTTSPGVIELQPAGSRGAAVSRVEVPFVDGAFVLTDVFSREEVAQIVGVSEKMGCVWVGASREQAGREGEE